MCPKYLPVGAFLFIMEDMKPRAPQQAHYRKGEYTMKRVLIITSSLRAYSNSDALAEAFARGAKDGGCDVTCVSLKGKDIAFCRGCLACQDTQACVIADDAAPIAEAMKEADVIAFATPVYYYGLAGQLKTLLDRANCLFPSDYRFRDIYLLASAAEDEATTMDGPVRGIQGWIDCFEKARLAGTVFAGGVNDGGDIEGHPSLQRAYEMGKEI